ETAGGQAKRRRSGAAGGQGESGGENVGELRHRGDRSIMIRRRAHENAGAEGPMKTGDAGNRPRFGAVGADGDHTAPPAARRGGVESSRRAPEHRMRSDERHSWTNARPRGFDHRLLDASDVGEDGAVAHAPGNGAEELEHFGHGRGQYDDLASGEV